MRNFLRYGQLIIELTDKPLVVGRASSCDVVIEDDLASREHCRIANEDGRIVLTDLESRNGVLVNGAQVSKRAELYHGDTITIGTQQMVLLRQHRVPRATPSIGELRQTSDDDEPTSQGDIFQILHGAAVTSLATKELTAAETSARSLFVAVRAALARARPLPPNVVGDAVALGITLAEQSGEARWLEQILELLTAARCAMDDRFLEPFSTLSRTVGRPTRALDEYLKMAREIGAAGSIRALSAL